MTGYVALAVLLLCAPLGLFLAHAIASRLARACGFGSVPPQTVMLCTGMAGNLPVVYLAWELALKNIQGPVEILCGVAYVLLTYNGVCFCYFCVLNVSETSLHVNILMRILTGGPARPEHLSQLYSVEHMINARIDRMIALGQLQQKGERYVGRDRTLLLMGRVYHIWRRVLGLPLSPE